MNRHRPPRHPMQHPLPNLLTLLLLFTLLCPAQASPPEPTSEQFPAGLPAGRSGSTWAIEQIAGLKQFRDMGNRHLVLDSAGHPRAVYGGDHLYYAWHDGTSWQTETVDDAPGVGRYPALALDDLDPPHVSYLDELNADLKYAYQSCLTIDSIAISGPHYLPTGVSAVYTATYVPPSAPQPSFQGAQRCCAQGQPIQECRM